MSVEHVRDKVGTQYRGDQYSQFSMCFGAHRNSDKNEGGKMVIRSHVSGLHHVSLIHMLHMLHCHME